jgi:ATP-dependent helicase/nuclease subunit A
MTNLFYFGSMGLIIYKSSAGSGKTFTLVHEFLLKVLDKPWLFRRILAITFTNKATEELKTRILRELDILASGEPSKHLQQLTHDLPRQTETSLRENAAQVLTRILHDYSSFSITTIDSYFQSLARILAREMQLPMKYDIELDTEAICREVTDMLLDDAGKEKFVTEWLEQLLLHRIDNGKNWNIHTELMQMTRLLLNSNAAKEHAKSINTDQLLSLIQWMNVERIRITDTMRNLGRKAIEIIHNNNLDENHFYYKKSGPYGYLLKISAKKSGLKEFGNINSYTQKVLSDPLVMVAKSAQKDAHVCALVTNEVHPLLQKACNFFEENQRKYTSIIEALKLVYQSGITGSLDEKLKEYREKHRLFHLSDTTRMLGLTVQDQDAPFIFEKSGNTYFHLFIDEFQDTATLQWEILKPLVLHILSTGNEVKIVGDAKQSIYRWRGGNMQLILQGVRDDLAHYNHPTEERNLNTNWRSCEQIIRFNNTFFPVAAASEADKFSHPTVFESAYQKDLEQKWIKAGGFVQFKYLESTKNKEEGTVEQWKAKSLQEMDNCISDLLTKGYSTSDIAILVRTNGHESEVADHLFQGGKYSFISSNSLLLEKQLQIIFLLNCLRILLHPENPLIHEETNQLLRKLGKPTDHLPQIPFRTFKKHALTNGWIHTHLLNQKKTLMCLPLNQVLNYLVNAAGLPLKDPFLHKFYDLVQDYCNGHGNNPAGFLSWWDEHAPTRKWSLSLPDGGDAIRIMTIHRSKGLEFPIVIMPFVDWDIVPGHRDILWAQGREEAFKNYGSLPLGAVKELGNSYFDLAYKEEQLQTALDNLNLLYVAFTRPEEKLFVFCSSNPDKHNAAKLVQDTLESIVAAGTLNLQKDGDTISLGENSPKKQKSSPEPSQELYKPTSFTPDFHTLTGENLKLPELISGFDSDEIRIGNMVHEAIALMENEQSAEAVLRTVLYRNRPVASVEKKVREQVSKVLDVLKKNAWTSEYFRILRETALCDAQGKILRPDYVLMNGGECIVIDFKTGKREDKYRQQVSDYCVVLRETGYTQTSGYIIYTNTAEVLRVE